MQQLYTLLVSVGPLRLLLILLTVLVILAAPLPQSGVEFAQDDWRWLVSIVSPSLFGLLLFVIPLDLTMMMLFRTAASNDRRRAYLMLVVIEAVAWFAMLVAWLPLLFLLLNRQPV